MEHATFKKYVVHGKKSAYNVYLTSIILIVCLIPLVYSVKNSNNQNPSNTPFSTNYKIDLTQETTLPFVNQAISSIDVDNGNEVNLSPSFNINLNKTQRIRREVSDANNGNSKLYSSSDNSHQVIQDNSLNRDNNIDAAYKTSYFNNSITKLRYRY